MILFIETQIVFVCFWCIYSAYLIQFSEQKPVLASSVFLDTDKHRWKLRRSGGIAYFR